MFCVDVIAVARYKVGDVFILFVRRYNTELSFCCLIYLCKLLIVQYMNLV